MEPGTIFFIGYMTLIVLFGVTLVFGKKINEYLTKSH